MVLLTLRSIPAAMMNSTSSVKLERKGEEEEEEEEEEIKEEWVEEVEVSKGLKGYKKGHHCKGKF